MKNVILENKISVEVFKNRLDKENHEPLDRSKGNIQHAGQTDKQRKSVKS